MPRKVLVAMSGGVDSSVAALLLKEQGYDVVGAHMKLWDYVDVGGDIHKDGRCCTIDSITDCRLVCDKIGAPFYVLNMSAKFRDTVIDNFVTEYRAGRTPNPCVMCNSDIKWSAFLQKARELGCEYIATGHYSFVEQGRGGRWQIRKGVDATRDQSYVLWGISQEALSMTLMPLGGLTKKEVRAIAEQHNLRTAKKPESREICFVADNDYRRFLREWEQKHNLGNSPGEIVHEDGTVLGDHTGTTNFTVGQRRGIGLAHPPSSPLYVQRIDSTSHRVIVGDNSSLYKTELIAENVNWVGLPPPNVGESSPQPASGSSGWPTIHGGGEAVAGENVAGEVVAGESVTGETSGRESRPTVPHPTSGSTHAKCDPGTEQDPSSLSLRGAERRSNLSPHPDSDPSSPSLRGAERRSNLDSPSVAADPDNGHPDVNHPGARQAERSRSLSREDATPPSFPALVKIRYLHTPGPAVITPLTGRRVHIKFTDKQRAITPGQSVVFYDNDILLGGGIIAEG